MNKADLISKVADNTGLTKKETTTTIEASLEVIAEALANGEKVSIQGFGIFGVRDRAARTGRNPRTGEEVAIAATRVPAWKPSKNLKESVNN